MVLLFLLLTFLGHIDATGWVGEYVKMDNANCQKLQLHYDRRQWSNYKNRYNDASEQLGDGDYPPNFLATSHDDDAHFGMAHRGLSNMRDVANDVGNSNIVDNRAPRCHGIKFSTRLGLDYDPTQNLDAHSTTVQYFCFEIHVGFSAVAFQSGQPIASFTSNGRSCFEFETVNSEYIEVYTFSTQNEGQFLLAFASASTDSMDRASGHWTDFGGDNQLQTSDVIGHLFQPSDGYITIRTTSPPVSDKLSVSVVVNGLVDEAKFGEIALTNIQCVNSDLPRLPFGTETSSPSSEEFSGWEVHVPGSSANWLLKLQDACGTQFRRETSVRHTASNVATTICKRPDGTCFQAHPGTKSFGHALNLCPWDSQPNGDLGWWDTICCESLLENYPWTDIMWAWTHEYIDGNDPGLFKEWQDAGIDMVDAISERVDDNEVMSMNARAFDGEGNTFTSDIFVGDPIEVHFEYDQKCPLLEVSFTFRPSDNNQDPISEVARFPIYKRPGIYASFMPLNTGMTLQQLDTMKYGQTLFHDEDGFQDTFIPYHDINFVTGDWAIPNYGLGDNGLNRYSHYQLGLRGALRVENDRTCSFYVPTSSGKVWFSLGGETLIDSDGKRMNQSNSSGIDIGEPTAFVNLRAGEFTYFDITYLHYGRPFGNEVTQVSLLWECVGYQMEVIPRKYLFNHGTANGRHGNLLTNTDHVDYTGSQAIGDPYSKFSLSLEFPRADPQVVRCTAPDGLVLSPDVITFGPGGARWTDWVDITIWEEPSFSGVTGPDEAIHCSVGDEEKVIYFTRAFVPSSKLSLAAAGLYSKFSWVDDTSNWQATTDSMGRFDASGQLFTRLFGYKHKGYSCHIQAMHDTIEPGNLVHPVVGFAFNFGRNVFAAYPTVNSAAWKPFFRESIGGIPLNQRLLITEGEGSLTIKTPNGIECNIKRVGRRYMDISCDIPGIINDENPAFSPDDKINWSGTTPLPLKDNFFKYPAQAQHLRLFDHVPIWGADNLPRDPSFANDVAQSADTGRNFDLSCVDSTAEKQFVDAAQSLNFDSLSIWRTIERNGGCPLLDDLYPSLQSFSMNFAFGGNIDTASVTRQIYQHCTMSMYFSKLTSCFSNYYFNENDARASVKNLLWYLTGTFIDASDMVPQNLVQSYGSDGQFCNKDGHLVGTPPRCACIGNGRYPDCDSSVSCGPSDQCQLSALQSSGSPTPQDGGSSARYCKQEKSIVIDPVSGHAIYCYTGFCTSWESVTSQRGLSLGTNPCDTPYCVTAVAREQVDEQPEDDVAWYGLTECGTGLVSRNAGRNWELVTVLDDDHCLNSMDCAKEIVDDEQTAEYDNLIWSWSTEEICLESASIDMKPLKYCVKWFCDCIDAEIWANLI